jgi:hypothetical protein
MVGEPFRVLLYPLPLAMFRITCGALGTNGPEAKKDYDDDNSHDNDSNNRFLIQGFSQSSITSSCIYELKEKSRRAYGQSYVYAFVLVFNEDVKKKESCCAFKLF